MGKSKKEKRQAYFFDNKALLALILPLVVEQLLAVLVGMADSIMIASVGEAAVSGVSLVDQIMVLLINAFSALATGGAVVAGQFLGQDRREEACKSATQMVWFITICAIGITVLVYLGKSFILHTVFGKIDQDVMHHADIYLLIVAASIPFMALYNGGAAIFRTMGNSKVTMQISIIMNVINIGGNAILIYGFHRGTEGVAIPTLVSRMTAAIIIIALLCDEKRTLHIERTWRYRINWEMVKKILSIGVPNGLENSMFQLGKLAIQSTVSTLGTTAIAAQAMTNMLEMLNGTAVIGVGIGLMTVVGQSLGAGKKDEAVYYMKKLMIFSEVFLIACCAVVYVLARPITMIGGMEAKSAEMCLDMMFWITIVKPIVWMFAFIPAYGMRAAGDVKFSMITSCITMWTFRFCLCVYLIRVCGMGPMAVWIGMFTDWTVRAIVFGLRFKSGKWMEHKVV